MAITNRFVKLVVSLATLLLSASAALIPFGKLLLSCHCAALKLAGCILLSLGAASSWALLRMLCKKVRNR